jgi:hypothetical protein
MDAATSAADTQLGMHAKQVNPWEAMILGPVQTSCSPLCSWNEDERTQSLQHWVTVFRDRPQCEPVIRKLTASRRAKHHTQKIAASKSNPNLLKENSL